METIINLLKDIKYLSAEINDEIENIVGLPLKKNTLSEGEIQKLRNYVEDIKIYSVQEEKILQGYFDSAQSEGDEKLFIEPIRGILMNILKSSWRGYTLAKSKGKEFEKIKELFKQVHEKAKFEITDIKSIHDEEKVVEMYNKKLKKVMEDIQKKLW